MQTEALAPQETNSLRPIVESAFRYRRMWFLVVLSLIVLTACYVILAPREYRSEMDLLVQNKRGDEQITPDRISGEITVNGVTEEQINSEIQLLRSNGLANLVVDPQWDSRSAGTLTREQLKAHDKAVANFEKHLSVSMIRKSNVIHVAYVAHNPRTATAVLQSLLNAFLLKQRQIAQPPGTAQFFASQAAHYKQQLDQAQQQLAQYQQTQGVVTLANSEQTLDSEINEAKSEQRATDAQISALSQELSTQTYQLKGIRPREMTQVRTIPNDYSIERLNTMIAQLENQRTALLTKFTPSDRLVQQINRQIANTKLALANAERMTSQEHDTDINPVWQSVTGSIIQNETEREALRAKDGALADQIKKLQGQLSTVEGSTVPFSTLRQKVAELENNYQLYTQKSDEARMADAMNENRLLNVAVAENPTYGVTAFRPKPVVDLILGSFTAVFLASFMVFFAEMGRGTFASSAEVERYARLPVLATVPLDHARGIKRVEFAPVFIGMTSAAPNGSPGRSPSLIRYRKEPEAV